MRKLTTLQSITRKEEGPFESLTHKIYNEDGAPYLSVRTNLQEKRIRFLIDTGASISLLRSDLIPSSSRKIDYCVNLFGIMGKDVSVKTEGMIHAIFEINGHFLGTTLHLVNRKYAGPADGYLGYDFLCPYGVTIDLDSMTMCLYPRKILNQLPQNKSHEHISIIHDEEQESKNFLYQLAENYEFEKENSSIKTTPDVPC